MKRKQAHFGEHLTIDGYNGSYNKLNNEKLVYKCLDTLPEKLGMHKLSKPVVYFAKGNDTKDPGGWSGFVVIEESHISIHTFPGRGFISADVYTCQNGLNVKKIKKIFKEMFELSSLETNFLIRGKKYPQENIW